MGVLCEVRRAKQALDKIEMAKINAQREKMGLPPIRPWYQNACTDAMAAASNFMKKLFCPCFYDVDLDIPCYRFALFRPGTNLNKYFRMFICFVCGCLLSLLWFLLMIYQLNFTATVSMVTCIVLGTILQVGMAFSESVRCLTLVMLPSLCSSKCRTLLLGYCFLLVMTHPVPNFSANLQVMSRSVTCGQQIAYNASREVVNAAVSPMQGIIADLRTALVEFSEKLREGFEKVRDLFIELANALDRTTDWLKDMVNICNHKMGEPYKKCKKAFDEAKDKCRKKMSLLKFTCEVVSLVRNVCNVARLGEVLCEMTKVIKEKAIKEVQKKVDLAFKNIHEMFYFKVELDYMYNFTLVKSRSFEEIRHDIQNEIKERTQPLFALFSISGVIVVLLLLKVVLKSMWYQHQYRTKDKFDNFYITSQVEQLEIKREETCKATIFPLQGKETKRYIFTGSFRLAKPERKKLATGLLMYFGTILHGGFYLGCDYGLYWILDMIKRHGSLVTDEQVASHVKMHVQGEGVLADIFRALITQFDPIQKSDLTIDTRPCLPNPVEPNWGIYRSIGLLTATCLLMVLCEAYLLRLRHMIAAMYYPARETSRAAWLYNHILRRRGTVLKTLRRNVKKNTTTQKEENDSFLGRLVARYPKLEKMASAFGHGYHICLGCAVALNRNDEKNAVLCENIGCGGVYCIACFNDLNNMCTACMKPIDYGDFSDISQEMDSSDEEQELLLQRRKRGK